VRVPDPRVSVLVELPDQLETLNSQTCDDVELITWNDDDWAAAAAEIAARHNWTHLRVANRNEAIEDATALYVVGWDAYRADRSALVRLLEAAERAPDTRGALAANFDPLILWRRDEFFGRTHRQGLAQAGAIAIGGAGGTQVHPPNQRASEDA